MTAVHRAVQRHHQRPTDEDVDDERRWTPPPAPAISPAAQDDLPMLFPPVYINDIAIKLRILDGFLKLRCMSGLHSWIGREFHKRGPAAAKVLSPKLLSVRGTTQAGTSADRRERRVLSDTRQQSSGKERSRRLPEQRLAKQTCHLVGEKSHAFTAKIIKCQKYQNRCIMIRKSEKLKARRL